MKKTLKWVIIALVIASIGAVGYTMKFRALSEEVIEVSKGSIKQYVKETATVVCHETRTVYVDCEGRVDGINVSIGDTVKKGNLLFNVINDDFAIQLKVADAKIAEAQAQLEGTKPDSYDDKIKLAKDGVEQSKVAYESAKRNFDKMKILFDSSAISEIELNNAEDTLKTATLALKTANDTLEGVSDGAPEYLKNAYMAQLNQAIANREIIQKNIKNQQVIATMDGVILEKSIDNDTRVMAKDKAFVIGDVDNLELKADILVDDISNVKIGDNVEISGKAVNDKVFMGRVTKIDPKAETKTSSDQNTISVTIEMLTGTEMIKPGYTLDVTIITSEKNDIVKVPDTSVFDYQGNSCVFAVEEGKAVLKTVEKGIEEGDYIEVEGIEEGEIILIKYDGKVKAGDLINSSK